MNKKQTISKGAPEPGGTHNFTFPPAFEDRMKQARPHDWDAFLQRHRHPAPTSVRRHHKKVSPTLAGTPVPWAAAGLYLPHRPVFTLDPLFHAGAYYVQEASSMLLEQAFMQHIPLQQPLNVLDLCAAPGGKSTHILSLVNPESLLVANEVIRSRAGILAENIQKWGCANAIVTCNDSQDFEALTGFFDVVVIDAPCSGEGLFRKDPGAMKEWSPENAALCAGRQKRILSAIFPTLKEGGILVYSTCTYNAGENEHNLQWLRQEHDVEFLRLKTEAGWGFEEADQDGIVAYRAMPHRVKGEGFFMAVVRKCGPAAEHRIKKSKKDLWQTPAKKLREETGTWVNTPEEKCFIQHNDSIRFFPAQKLKETEHLRETLQLVAAGTHAASVKHDKLVPDHALALSADLDPSRFHTIPLSEQEALQYLRKDQLTVNTDVKGFSLVTYQNIPLGWVNVLKDRINNMYPSAWRIRRL